MPSENNVKEYGRFVYFEPNNMNLDKPDNAIPNPYEDYSIAVNLQVFVQERNACGSDGGTMLEFSSDNGTLSFMGGSGADNGNNGYLTTNFTDISANNVGKGNKECLGIESINISYNTWWFPSVQIRFVDIRGASLFMPQENAMVAGIAAGSTDITQVMGGSFFKSLFTFPYPIFKLTVKGYYGKPVTYTLTIEKTKFDFDSSTGNFVADVSFIGYMYGVYTDIPMRYLATAPYINKSAYWDVNDNFTLGDGVKIPTFPEFWKNLSFAVNKSDKEQNNSPAANNLRLVNEKNEKLNIILKKFQDFNFEIVPNTIEYYKWIEDGYEETFKKNIENFVKLLSDYDEIYFSVEIKNIKDANKNINTIEELSKEFVGPFDFDKYVNDNNDNNKKYLFRFKGQVSEKVKNLQEDILNKKTEAEKELAELRIKSLNEVLGFDLTIKNVFKIIFAHMDTFVHWYYSVLNKVKSQDRKPEMFGGIQSTDLSRNWKSSVPPYPLVTQPKINNRNKSSGSETRTVVWPEEVSGEIEETKFVKEFLVAASLYDKAVIDNSKELEEMIARANGTPLAELNFEEFIPITIGDLFRTENPYRLVKTITGPGIDDDYGKYISLIFFLRAYYFFMEFPGARHKERFLGIGDKNFFENRIGEIEAVNFYKANSNLTENIQKYYQNSNNFNLDSISNYKFIKDKDNLFNTKDSDSFGKAYTWLTDGKSKILPINEYSVNKINGETSFNGPTYVFINEKGNFDDEKNVNSFTIQSGDYFDNFIERVTSDGDSDEIKKIKKFYRDTIYTQTKGSGYDYDKGYSSYLANYTYELNDPDKYYQIFGNVTGDGFVRYDILDEGKKNVNTIIGEKIINGKNTDNFEYYDTCADSYNNNRESILSSASSIFVKDYYSGQTNIIGGDFEYDGITIKSTDFEKIRKAYLFLFSVPINKNYIKDCDIDNIVILKTRVLREGAHHFRNLFVGQRNEPFLSPIDENVPEGYKNFYSSREIDIIPIKEGSGTKINTILFGDATNFEKWDTTRKIKVSESRKKELIKYFLNWVINSLEWNEIYTQNEKGNRNTEYFNGLIVKLYSEVVTIVDYAKAIGKGVSNNDLNRSLQSVMDVAYNAFIKKLKELYKEKKVIDTEIVPTNLNSFANNIDMQLSSYLNMKNLYDKWFCSNSSSKWMFPGAISDSDFNDFLFVDSYFNDIGDSLIVNGAHLLEVLKSFVPSSESANYSASSKYNGISVYEMMSLICEKNGLMFMSIPQKFGLNTKVTTKDVSDMFTAWPFTKLGEINNVGQSYVCMYTYKPSGSLDMDDKDGLYNYANDSFYIVNDNGQIDENMPECLSDMEGGDKIPAFSVSFARQGQSMFKGFSLESTDQKVTEAELAATQQIAAKGAEGPRESVLYGQDIYRIFANYAYKCSVEMLGNSQIMPLMYFQLNNVPMWRGAYMIISVEHQIKANHMTTKFTGVRQSKNAIPLIIGGETFVDAYGNTSRQTPSDGGSGGNQTGPAIRDTWDVAVNAKEIIGTKKNPSVTKAHPIIYLTSAHGYRKRSDGGDPKLLEGEWSGRFVEKLADMLRKTKWPDNSGYMGSNICVQNNWTSKEQQYNFKPVRTAINEYGSDKVISIVPHWNGGGGKYYCAVMNWGGARQDSIKLSKCFIDTGAKYSEKMNAVSNELIKQNMCDGSGRFYGDAKITDPACKLDCACVLTENWFADFGDKQNWDTSDHSGKVVLESDEGMQVLAELHREALLKYLADLNYDKNQISRFEDRPS